MFDVLGFSFPNTFSLSSSLSCFLSTYPAVKLYCSLRLWLTVLQQGDLQHFTMSVLYKNQLYSVWWFGLGGVFLVWFQLSILPSPSNLFYCTKINTSVSAYYPLQIRSCALLRRFLWTLANYLFVLCSMDWFCSCLPDFFLDLGISLISTFSFTLFSFSSVLWLDLTGALFYSDTL